MFSDKIVYQSVASDDNSDYSDHPQSRVVKEKLRRRKSALVLFFILLVAAVYIVISIVLPIDTEISNISKFSTNEPSEADRISKQGVQNFIGGSPAPDLKYMDTSTEPSEELSTTEIPEEIQSNPTGAEKDANLEETTPKVANDATVEEMACHIPKLEPFAKKIRHLVKKPDFVNCTDALPLLFKSTYNSTLVPVDNLTEYLDVKSCCFQTVERSPGADDDSYRISEQCYPLSMDEPTSMMPKNETEFVTIYCDVFKSTSTSSASSTSSSEASDTTDSSSNDSPSAASSTNDNPEITTPGEPATYSRYIDLHMFVPKKEKVEKRVREYYRKLEKRKTKTNTNDVLLEHERLSIVIMGIDAVSHMNFVRTMQKSYTFLMNNLSAVEMNGYNKMGDNTLPNIGAVLTGLNESEVSLCEKNKAFDECPFVWKNYQENGFRTAFSEDSPWMGIFNYLKNGFQSPPTDYYSRHAAQAAEDLVGSHKELNAKLCYGPRLSFQVMLDYLQKMAYTMGHSRRYFQFIWATGLTHDFLNEGRLGDDHLLSTLEWFQRENYLNNTMLIVMSDHGIRWGAIRDFHQGLLEERLPFLYLVAPTWFKEKYPEAFGNLKINQNRLTSPFDLHATLVDLLDLRRITSKSIGKREDELLAQDKSYKLPRAISLFLPIPKSRTCEMAEIPEHYCTCHESSPVRTSHPIARQAASYAVFEINTLVSRQSKCSYLSLGSISHARVVGNRFKRTYQISFKTSPGNASFEASVIKNQTGFWKISGKISRINLYSNESHCTDVKDLKLYCYCTDLLG